MVSKKVSWLMLGSYLHFFAGAVWADTEALSHTYIYLDRSPVQLVDGAASGLKLRFSNPQKNMNFEGELSEAGLMMAQDMPENLLCEKVFHPESQAWGYVFSSDDLGKLYVNHDGSMAYVGTEKGRGHSLSLYAPTPIILRNVCLQELILEGTHATFTGTNFIDTLRAKSESDDPLGLGVYDLAQGASLEIATMTLENLNFLNQGMIIQDDSLTINMPEGAFLNQGKIEAQNLFLKGDSLILQGSLDVSDIKIEAAQSCEIRTPLTVSDFAFSGPGDIIIHQDMTVDRMAFTGTGILTNKSNLIAREFLEDLMGTTLNQGIMASAEKMTLDHHVINSGNMSAKNLEWQENIFFENQKHERPEISVDVEENLITRGMKARLHNQGHIRVGKRLANEKSGGSYFKEFFNQGTFLASDIYIHSSNFLNTGLIQGSGSLVGTLTNQGQIKGPMSYCVDRFINEGYAEFSHIYGSKGICKNQGVLKGISSYKDAPQKIAVDTFIHGASLEGDYVQVTTDVKTFHTLDNSQINAKKFEVQKEKAAGSFMHEGNLKTEEFLYGRTSLDMAGVLESGRCTVDTTSFDIKDSATFYTTGLASIKAQSLSNAGKLLFKRNAHIVAVRLFNKQNIQSEDDLDIQVQDFENAGVILAQKALSIDAEKATLQDSQRMVGMQSLTLKNAEPLTFKGQGVSKDVRLKTPSLIVKKCPDTGRRFQHP